MFDDFKDLLSAFNAANVRYLIGPVVGAPANRPQTQLIGYCDLQTKTAGFSP